MSKQFRKYMLLVLAPVALSVTVVLLVIGFPASAQQGPPGNGPFGIRFERVAFYAELDLASVPVPSAGVTQVVVFGTDFIDTHDAYDTTTGRFTAPVAGVYYFSTILYYQGQLVTGGSLSAIIGKNGGMGGSQNAEEVTVVSTASAAGPLGIQTVQATGMFELEEGDFVEALASQTNSSGNILMLDLNATVFRGFRVH